MERGLKVCGRSTPGRGRIRWNGWSVSGWRSVVVAARLSMGRLSDVGLGSQHAHTHVFKHQHIPSTVQLLP